MSNEPTSQIFVFHNPVTHTEERCSAAELEFSASWVAEHDDPNGWDLETHEAYESAIAQIHAGGQL